MKISRNSWHYRLWQRMWGVMMYNGPGSLCTYFWQITIPLLLAAALAVFLMVCFIRDTRDTLISMGVVVVGGVLGIGSVFIMYQIGRWQYRREQGHQDNLLVAFVKAKKAKICPRIEVVD